MLCEPFLNIGIIFAIFQSLGNLPFAKVISNKAFSVPAACNANSLSRTACRPSGPTDYITYYKLYIISFFYQFQIHFTYQLYTSATDEKLPLSGSLLPAWSQPCHALELHAVL